MLGEDFKWIRPYPPVHHGKKLVFPLAADILELGPGGYQ
jgi:hypothetical protein